MPLSLGLTSDDQNLHDERIKLWNDFNHAWLAMFQRQKEMMESGQQLQRGQSLVPQDGLQKMGKDLVRLCDSIERHGLVDYQYGVWEEQIIASRFRPSLAFWPWRLLTMPCSVLEECLDLYESSNSSGGGGEGSSNNRRR